MSRTEQASKLVTRALAVLEEVPLPEPDWEAFAARVEQSLGTLGPTDDSLLLPPLPESIEDGRLPLAAPEGATDAGHGEAERGVTAPAEPPAPALETAAAKTEPGAPPRVEEGASLAELARQALERRGAKEAVTLAKQSLAIASQGRGAETPPVAAEPSIVVEQGRTTLPPAGRRRPALDTRGPWIGVAIAAVGLAAGFGLYLAGQRHTTLVEPPSATVATPSLTAAAATAAPRAEPAAPEPEREAEASAAPEPVEPEELAPDTKTPKASLAAAEPRTSSSPSASAPHVEKIVLEEERSAAASGAKAATPAPTATPKPAPSAAMRPAELGPNGGLADRPSTGAAQAAVGAVLGAARACLAGQPEASNATIVFGSGGTVTGVSVGGPAQGTPAASCIQAALGKARLQPFAARSFSLGVTVRPP